MNFLHKAKQVSLIALSLFSVSMLSGCATTFLYDRANTPKLASTDVVLSETITAVGVPTTPIKSHPNALVLVGQNYSILATPTGDTKNHLFQDILKQVDLRHLYLNVKPHNNDTPNISSQPITIKLGDNDSVESASYYLPITFVKPAKQLKKNEETTLKDLGFDCKTVTPDKSETLLICHQRILTQLTLASKVQSIKNSAYGFKTPLTINYVQENYKKRNKLKLLTPLTVAIDVALLPVSVVGTAVALVVVPTALLFGDWN